jgi:PAS domain S-box-containing protein
MVENSTDGIVVVQKGIIKFLNPPLLDLSGYHSEELMDKGFETLLSPEYRKLIMDRYQARLAGKEVPSMYEMEIIRKDGVSVPIEASSTTITYGGDTATLSFIRNITERRRAEESIQESEEKYRLIADNSIDVIWQMNLKLVLTYVSPSIDKAMGYTVDEWVGTRLSAHASTKEFLNMAKEALYAIRHYQEFKYITFDAVMLRKDGTETPVEITGIPLLSRKGLPIGLQGTTRDITERKQAAAEVRRHLERLEALREIDMAITSTLDLANVLDIILEEIERVIPYDSAGIFLLSDGTAKLTAGRGFPDMELALRISFPVKDDVLTREILQEKRPMILADAQADERFRARGGTDYVRSWIGVPLMARGEAVGFLTMDHREPGVYDEASAEMARAFSGQVAIAIENARLYEEAQRELAERKRAEEALRERMRELETFYRATLGREERVIELKQEVNELLEQLGRNKEYRDYA